MYMFTYVFFEEDCYIFHFLMVARFFRTAAIFLKYQFNILYFQFSDMYGLYRFLWHIGCFVRIGLHTTPKCRKIGFWRCHYDDQLRLKKLNVNRRCPPIILVKIDGKLYFKIKSKSKIFLLVRPIHIHLYTYIIIIIKYNQCQIKY